MKIEIEIPEEFEEEFKRYKFEDALYRLITDAHSIAGNYEKETAEMLIKAFRESKPVRDKEIMQGTDSINYIQSEIARLENDRKNSKTFTENILIDGQIKAYKEMESRLDLQKEEQKTTIAPIDFSKESFCDEVMFGEMTDDKYKYVNFMLYPTYNLVEKLCERVPIFSELGMSYDEIMNDTDITFDIYVTFYKDDRIEVELSTSDYDSYYIGLSKSEQDNLFEQANDYCIHNTGKTIQQAMFVESEEYDINKKTYIAIESTEDYTTADFHKELVDITKQNKNGTYGRMVDYYRLVTIGMDKTVVPLNDKVYESYEDAVKSVPATYEFEIIGYDDMIHLSEKEQAYEKTVGKSIEPVSKDFTFVVNECMEYNSLGDRYENIKSIDEAIAIMKKLQGNMIAGIGVYYDDVEYELISGNNIIDTELNRCVYDIYPNELKENEAIKNALKVLHKEFDEKEQKKSEINLD